MQPSAFFKSVVLLCSLTLLCATEARSATSSTVSFVSASSAQDTAGFLAIPAPGGTVAGDVLVAIVDVIQAPAINAPAGWTLIRSDVNPVGNHLRQAAYVHVTSLFEPPSYTWTFSASHGAAGGI